MTAFQAGTDGPGTTPTDPPSDVLGVADLVPGLDALLDLSAEFKAGDAAGTPLPSFPGKAGILLFEQPSTRTRASLEVALGRLDMTAVALDGEATQLSRGESLEDTARALGRYGDVLVHRTADHRDLEALARHAPVPVVNALTDREHPCQALADLLTLREANGPLADQTLAYVGDGNNVCHSLVLAARAAGATVRVASPQGHGPDEDVLSRARALAPDDGAVPVVRDPVDAVAGADAVYTDVWASMHHEDGEGETGDRLAAFDGYTVDRALLDRGDDPVLLHCLPAHYGEEVTRAALHGPRSVAFDQAENRLWTAAAVLAWLVGEAGLPGGPAQTALRDHQ